MPGATQHSLSPPKGLGDGQGPELFELESNTSCARLLGTRVCLFVLPLWWRMQPQKLFLEISPHAELFWLHWRQSRKLGRDWVLVASMSFCAQIHPEAWPASELPTWVNKFLVFKVKLSWIFSYLHLQVFCEAGTVSLHLRIFTVFLSQLSPSFQGCSEGKKNDQLWSSELCCQAQFIGQ